MKFEFKIRNGFIFSVYIWGCLLHPNVELIQTGLISPC